MCGKNLSKDTVSTIGQQKKFNYALQPMSRAEFKKIVDNPGADAFSPVHALAHLCLGRAAALTGDTAAARKSYQDFFALWKDADQDLPILVEVVDQEDRVRAALPHLDSMVTDGLITLERVEVIAYRANRDP